MSIYFQIRATGKGDFPLDMLRYSQCWPIYTQDVENMGCDIDERIKYLKKRSVTLGLIGNDSMAEHCILRFKSYNWDAEIIRQDKV